MSEATAASQPPSPAFLPRERRSGRHKIFLGMAAGVGKTFRMLIEGRVELEAGRDVVIGLLETHGRAETAQLADGLPTLPRMRVSYRQAELEEMDLRAVLNRRPELCLIDELAHTNAPGTEHTKRYEDVEEILAAGIDVIIDAQRAAPRVAERPRHRAERHPCARDDPRRDRRAR